MYAWHPPRALSASLSLAIVGLIAAALVFGLGVRRVVEAAAPLISVSLESPPPPPPAPRPPPPRPRTPKAKAQTSAAEDKPSPRNLRNQATAVVAPPVKPIIVPPPVVVAPVAGTGAAANTGASDRAGPGQGAGGFGNGNGGGGNGGNGEGDSDAATEPQPIVDHLRTRGLPLQLLPPGEPITLEVLAEIGADGHVTGCRIARHSRYSDFDQVICPLIEQQYRYRPARDEDGRPVSVTMTKSETFTYMAR